MRAGPGTLIRESVGVAYCPHLPSPARALSYIHAVYVYIYMKFVEAMV